VTLEIRNVSFAYSGIDALRNVTVSLGANQLVAVAGPNGSGKSTLLKLAARVLQPLRGEIAYEGRALRQWPAKEYAKRVGYLPQDPEPVFPMRAIDVVVSGRAPFLGRFEWESERDFAAARDALATCDAAHLADRYLDEMSGGERKRVFLARVLAAAPRVILLDEPLSALDVAHVQQFSRLLRDIVDRSGSTIAFASHDLNWAAAYSDRMLVMRGGTLALDAAPAEVMRREVVSEVFGFEADVVNGWLVPRGTQA
jgi:ABC-type cobalamin/Fe3+-siderophores transport system ATPase subunit